MKYGCWQCHGIEGQGSAITSNGKVLAPDPLPLETFAAFVRSTNRAMPPYSEKVLPNEDLADMHAYLSSIPKPKDYKSIPLLEPVARRAQIKSLRSDPGAFCFQKAASPRSHCLRRVSTNSIQRDCCGSCLENRTARAT